jgi:hypothetical protein
MAARPFVALIAVASLVAAATSASAHRFPPPPHEMYAKADVVLVGKVESIGTRTMHVLVGQTLKGEKKDAVDVGPVEEPGCLLHPEGKAPPVKPDFAVGDRVLVVATVDKNVLWLMGTTFEARLKDDAAEKRAVAFAREMLRIVALPDIDARREAMIAHLSSEDADLVGAAAAFQSAELDTPEKSRPHAAALVAALDAPTNYGRAAAMRALVGVGAPEAFDRLIALSKRRDADTSRDACEALACYDREEVVVALVAAGHLALLGESPRPEVRALLLRALAAEDLPSRAAGFAGFAARFRRAGATSPNSTRWSPRCAARRRWKRPAPRSARSIRRGPSRRRRRSPTSWTTRARPRRPARPRVTRCGTCRRCAPYPAWPIYCVAKRSSSSGGSTRVPRCTSAGSSRSSTRPTRARRSNARGRYPFTGGSRSRSARSMNASWSRFPPTKRARKSCAPW